MKEGPTFWTATEESPLLSPADMAVVFTVALLLFGPERLPSLARSAGRAVRELRGASQAFVREMEQAADLHERVRREHPPESVSSKLEE